MSDINQAPQMIVDRPVDCLAPQLRSPTCAAGMSQGMRKGLRRSKEAKRLLG